MSSAAFRDQARERWPKFNKGDRERAAVILRRIAHLKREREARHNSNNHWIIAEIAALEWTLTLVNAEHERIEP